MSDDLAHRRNRARFRAWHRGTREADYVFGGFFDRHHAGWRETDLAWFEALLDEDDVDVLAWAFGAAEPPPALSGQNMDALRRLDFVTI